MYHVRKNPLKQTFKSRRGFTLAEVMIAAAISVIAMIGLLGTTILSYKYAMMARYKERATNALLTIADQFQNSPVHDHTATSYKYPDGYKTLFKITDTNPDGTAGTTGTGMAWNSDLQCFVYPGSGTEGTTVLNVPLYTVGDTTLNTYYAHVTRSVSFYDDLYPEAGTAPNNANGNKDPFMLQAILTAKYPFDSNGNPISSFLGSQTVSIKVLRTITKTDVHQ